MFILSLLEVVNNIPIKTPFKKKIDFILDQTLHNVEGEEIAAENLSVVHVAENMFYYVHPLLMFNKVITKQ